MQNIDLLHELEKVQVELEQNAVLREVESILNDEHTAELEISSRLSKTHRKSGLDWNWIELLEDQRTFHPETIEHICTRFRLRFLDSELFKGDIPAEAIREVKRIEGQTGVTFEAFKVIAPAERFDLKDSTKDPILMAELSNGQFYYIFQWGDDMAWYQHILKYPFRHIGALAATSSVIGLLVAFLVPSQFEAAQAEFFYRFFMFSLSTCLVMTLSIIVAIMYSKDFSENVWNSKFIR